MDLGYMAMSYKQLIVMKIPYVFYAYYKLSHSYSYSGYKDIVITYCEIVQPPLYNLYTIFGTTCFGVMSHVTSDGYIVTLQSYSSYLLRKARVGAQQGVEMRQYCQRKNVTEPYNCDDLKAFLTNLLNTKLIATATYMTAYWVLY